VRVAAVPFEGGELGEERCGEMNRILRELRVRDVALDAPTMSLPESVPRRPFLIVSPKRSTEVGSPTTQ